MKLQAGVQSQTFRSKLSFMRSTAGKTKLAESLAWPTDAAGLALKKGNGKPEGTLPTLKSQTKKRMIWPSCWVRGLALHRRLLREAPRSLSKSSASTTRACSPFGSLRSPRLSQGKCGEERTAE